MLLRLWNVCSVNWEKNSYLTKTVKILFNQNETVISIAKNGWKLGITKLKATEREKLLIHLHSKFQSLGPPGKKMKRHIRMYKVRITNCWNKMQHTKDKSHLPTIDRQ